jgi:predicted  nucleic acid-binding Zn-ribbon protein
MIEQSRYLTAKRTYLNARDHEEALRRKRQKTNSRINHLNSELLQQQSRLQRLDEKLTEAREKLRAAKEVYGPLRQAWKAANPKQRVQSTQEESR